MKKYLENQNKGYRFALSITTKTKTKIMANFQILKNKIIYIVINKNLEVLEVFYYYNDAVNYIDNLEEKEDRNLSSIITKEIKI